VSEALEHVQDVTDRLRVEYDELLHSNAQLATPQATFDVLVLDARLRQSLATVRSLGRRGLRVAALGTTSDIHTFSSRWCSQAFVCSADEGTEEYFSYLDQLLNRFKIGVLITSSDATLSLIRQHREQLEPKVRIALAKEPALGIAINKERTLEVARRLGLNVPRAVSVESVGEVEAALDEIGLPAIIKPTESWAWNQSEGDRLECKLVKSVDEAKRVVEDLTRFGGNVLFQQFISGKRQSISLIYANQHVYACYAQWHTRIVGGESAVRQSIAVPTDIGEQAERLVREIDLEGCSEVEFRRDAAEMPYLMEINPRLWASTELAVRSGVDFPYLLYQWASGEKIDEVKTYPVGARLRYLRGDILNTAAALIPSRQRGRPEMEKIPPTRAILDFLLTFFSPMGYDCVDWKDPLPIWTSLVAFAREVFGSTGRHRRRKNSSLPG
jgi:predicted ATP-grasp superfamily ATP-dependent carboligase